MRTFAILVCGVGLENGLKVVEIFENAGGSELLCSAHCLCLLVLVV